MTMIIQVSSVFIFTPEDHRYHLVLSFTVFRRGVSDLPAVCLRPIYLQEQVFLA